MKRTVGFLLTTMGLAVPVSRATEPASIVDRFAGTWKEDQSKRHGAELALRFQKAADGTLQELRGPDARPLAETIHFDGKQYELTSGNAIVWKQINADTFERTLMSHGKVLQVRRIQIAPGGKTLTEKTERKLPDGKTTTTTVTAERMNGSSNGLEGRWTVTSLRSSDPEQIMLQAAGSNSLQFLNSYGWTFTISSDGKSWPASGPTLLPNTTVTSRVIDANSIEIIMSREAVPTWKEVLALSANGKTLTLTTTDLAPSAKKTPGVSVYDKQ